MRILSKPDGIDDLLNNIDLSSSIDAFLALDEPVGIADLRNRKNDLMNEIMNYHIEMSQNGHLSHNARVNFSKYNNSDFSKPKKFSITLLSKQFSSRDILWMIA